MISLLVALLVGILGTYQFLDHKYKNLPEKKQIGDNTGYSAIQEGKSWVSPFTGMEMMRLHFAKN